MTAKKMAEAVQGLLVSFRAFSSTLASPTIPSQAFAASAVGTTVTSIMKPWDTDTHTNVSATFAERHYTPAEIAQLWGMSKDSVRRLFKNEPGVLAISPRQRRGKREYVTLSQPESVEIHADAKQPGAFRTFFLVSWSK